METKERTENEIIRASENIDKTTKVELSNLVEHYSQFFSPLQIDALFYFWYGYTPADIAKTLDISDDLITEWLSNKAYKEAIQAGKDRKKEVLINQLESHALKAVDFVGEVMDSDISNEDKGFREKINLAKWIIEKMDVRLDPEADEDSRRNIRMDAETARIFAEEIRKTAVQSSQGTNADIKVEEIFREEPIEGEVIEPLNYYNFVDSSDSLVDYGVVNVRLTNDDEYKMQCHLCGDWKSSLYTHLAKSSKHSRITLDMYRRQFGIPKHIPLSISEEFLEIVEEADV